MDKVEEAVWTVIKDRCIVARAMMKKGRPLQAKWELGYAQGTVMALGGEGIPEMTGYIAKLEASFGKVWGEVETALDFYHRVQQEGLVTPTLEALDEWKERKGVADVHTTDRG